MGKNRIRFNRTLKKIKCAPREPQYHGILALSGGKDSTYLLYRLVERYKLKILAVNVDLGFETETSKNNIQHVTAKIGCDLKMVRLPNSFTYKMYNHLIAGSHHGKEGCIDLVCGICHLLLLGIVAKQAYEKGIKYVFVGETMDEVRAFVYQVPLFILRRNLVPRGIVKSKLFTPEEISYFWNGRKLDRRRLPKVVAPLHAFPYNTEEIRKFIADKDLVEYDKSDPSVTNCKIIPLLFEMARKKNKPLPYIYHFATQIREKAFDRDKALLLLERSKQTFAATARETARELNIPFD